MIFRDPKEDVRKRRRVVLHGRIVTLIDLAGDQARIAEDGKWYPRNEFHALTEEDLNKEHVDAVTAQVSGKSIATIKPYGTGVQLVLDDNTRLSVEYSKHGGITFSVLNSDGKKVV